MAGDKTIFDQSMQSGDDAAWKPGLGQRHQCLYGGNPRVPSQHTGL